MGHQGPIDGRQTAQECATRYDRYTLLIGTFASCQALENERRCRGLIVVQDRGPVLALLCCRS